MGVIVGSSSSFVECNTCNNKTSKIHGNDSGQRAAKNAIEHQWDISLVTGDAVCPECRQKEIERAKITMTSNETKCPQCGHNLHGSWHDTIHEAWEVGQANTREGERQRRKRALSPSSSKDNRIQYILKLCLESDDIRHKQWGLWKIGEILDIDISDVDADSGREP